MSELVQNDKKISLNTCPKYFLRYLFKIISTTNNNYCYFQKWLNKKKKKLHRSQDRNKKKNFDKFASCNNNNYVSFNSFNFS